MDGCHDQAFLSAEQKRRFWTITTTHWAQTHTSTSTRLHTGRDIEAVKSHTMIFCTPQTTPARHSRGGVGAVVGGERRNGDHKERHHGGAKIARDCPESGICGSGADCPSRCSRKACGSTKGLAEELRLNMHMHRLGNTPHGVRIHVVVARLEVLSGGQERSGHMRGQFRERKYAAIHINEHAACIRILHTRKRAGLR